MNETRKSIGLYNRGEIKYVNNISKRTQQQSHQQTTTCKWNPFMMKYLLFHSCCYNRAITIDDKIINSQLPVHDSHF